MAQMNVTPLEVLTDEVFGKVGTPKRDAMELQLKEDIKDQCKKRVEMLKLL